MKPIKSSLKIVLTGGGTGGHIYPAIAIGKGIGEKIPNASFHYIGTSSGLEAQLVPREGWPFYPVAAAGLERRLSWRSLLALLTTAKGYFQARKHLKRIRPRVVIGTGGYVCGPVVLAAARLGIPTLIHEQNAYPGLTNRLLSRVANLVCITFAQGGKYFPPDTKLAVTGLPVRKQILETTRTEGLEMLNLPEGFYVLIVGGSQGARSLNKEMIKVYQAMKDNGKINWLHITGKAAYDEYLEELAQAGIDLSLHGNIRIIPYMYQMEGALGIADLVIGRAGAGFLAEITAKGIPSILIPYPFAAENHQEFNARALEDQGAALVITEETLLEKGLVEPIQELLENRKKLGELAQNAKEMGQVQALEKIVDHVLNLAETRIN